MINTVACQKNNSPVENDEVQLTSSIILSGLTRQDKLRIWLLANRLTFQKLGKFLDVATTNARQLCLSDTAPPYRVDQLKAVGIPEELLPEPKYIPPGPKPKRQDG